MHRRWFAFIALAACLAPTEIELAITTNVSCKDLSGTRIRVGNGDASTTDLTTTQCDDAGIGSIVIVPGPHSEEVVDINVTAGVRVAPDTCDTTTYGADSGVGCIVARRSIRFSSHHPLPLPIALDLDCLDVSCDPGSTCYQSHCVPSTVDCDAGCIPTPATRTPVQIAVGYGHACARMNDGTVECWGDSSSGQLGSSLVKPGLPSTVDVINDAIDIAAGGDTTCVVRSNGNVMCWGANDVGQALGTTTTQRMVPSPAATQVTNAKRVSVGALSTCALLADASVVCWGDRGDGTIVSFVTEKPALQTTLLSVGGSAGAYTDGIQTIILFGIDAGDQLNAPANTGLYVVRQVVTSLKLVALSMGYLFGCVADIAGQVACWGANDSGQLGQLNTSSPATQSVIQGLSSVTALAAGSSHACAIAAGALTCWGGNINGQLGLGDTLPHTPTVVPVKGNVDAVAAGLHNTCILQGTKVTCWGGNVTGQLGFGATGSDQLTPGAPVAF